jgi:uncharacterized protein DUF1579
MSVKKVLSIVCIAAAGMAVIGSFAIADASKDSKTPAGLPADIKLPPGWTMEDMQACILAATPGKMHEHLVKEVGTWDGKTTMYMPGSDPQTSECTMTIKSLMGGRFTQVEIKGDMPGMGPYEGFGIYGYDNVSKKFVSSWIDNQGTGVMQCTGALSDDGKVLTWACTYNCPLQKKAVAMREIDTITGPNTKRFEMFGPDPKTGKESKMMTIDFTKKG